jgi:PHS family inorganic phosphate transporter-like MFS transporter
VFPTRVRSTAHGISAAVGKAGAVLTTFAFGSVTNAIGIWGVFGIMSGYLFLTALITLMIPETRGNTLEDIENGVLYGDAIESPVTSDNSLSGQKSFDVGYPVESKVKVVKDVVKEIR